MMKAIVSGASGFVGTALCRELAEQGIEVIAIVKDENENTDAVKKIKNLRLVFADLSEYRKLGTFIKDRDVDVFYHLAWAGSAGTLRSDYKLQLDNVRYVCDAVMSCKEIRCRRFVFASSVMEYEVSAVMNLEGRPAVNTLYSSAKLCADYMAHAIAADNGVEYIRAVISNIYGPGERSARLVNTSLRKMLHKEHCSFSKGEQMYDFIYIDDAVKEFAAIGSRGTAGRTYYIGSLNPKPLKEFLAEMRDQAAPGLELGFGEIPFDGISLTYQEFDVEAVKNDTGVAAEISFAEGIRRTIAWIKEHG